jgi:hypothetical protein
MQAFKASEVMLSSQAETNDKNQANKQTIAKFKFHLN